MPAKPRIVQALCPLRHCIAALAYEPGELTEANAANALRGAMDASIASGEIHPRCEICGAPRAAWAF
jgi:hypothetical protein